MFIIFCYGYKHLLFSYQPEMNFIENKYLPGLLMSYPGLLHVKTGITEKVLQEYFGKYIILVKSLWNINTRIKKFNCLCYNLWAEKYPVPPTRRSKFHLNFQKSSPPGKYTPSKFSSPPPSPLISGGGSCPNFIDTLEPDT